MTNETPKPAPARPGRERSCTHCGNTYRSPRQSRYCGNACRMKAKRGVASAVTPSRSILTRILIRLDMVGLVSRAAAYGLTVPRDYALAELRSIFDRKGWGYLPEAEFLSSLRADGVQGYSTDSPEAAERKRLQARMRAATARA